MFRFPTKKRAVTVAAYAAALFCGGALIGAPAATAAPVTTAAPAATAIPHAATGCNGEVCMHITTPSSSGKVTVNVWTYASGYKFYGHYELLTGVLDGLPLGDSYNSPTGTWGHTNSYYWRNVSDDGGPQVCVIGWLYSGGTNHNIGEPCESVPA